MASPLLLDTDVLIEYLLGQPDAVAFLRKTRRSLFVTAVTVAELHVGVREGAERPVLDLFLGLMEVVANAGNRQAGRLVEARLRQEPRNGSAGLTDRRQRRD